MEDEVFNGLPELTEDQLGEINDCFPHYLFFQKAVKNKIGIAGINEKVEFYECTCSHCKGEFIQTIDQELKHNQKTECPRCEYPVTAKNKSYGKKCLNKWIRVVLMCPETYNKVWIRAFYAHKEYSGHSSSYYPETSLSETMRYLLRPKEKSKCWEKCYSYVQEYKTEWLEINPREPFQNYMGFGLDYYCLSWSKLKQTFLKYHTRDPFYYALDRYYYTYRLYSRNYPIRVPEIKYLCQFSQYPIIESLMKAGFGVIVAAKVYDRKENKRLFNWEAEKLTDFFKTFDRDEIRVLRDANSQFDFINDYLLFRKAFGRKGIQRYQHDKETFGIFFKDILSLIIKYKLRYTHSLNYMIAQTYDNRPIVGIKIKNDGTMIGIYADYLRFAKELGYDMKNEVITHPKNLMKAHSKADKAVAAIQKQQAIEKAKEVTAELVKKYAFEYAGMKIVIPTCPDDIIREGKKLKHCVGGYSDRHFSGTLSILFIRKSSEPDKPYVTMEVRGKKIMQVHGYRNDVNKPLSKEVLDFVEEFKSYINDPKKYEKVRKNDERYNSIGKIQQGGPAA